MGLVEGLRELAPEPQTVGKQLADLLKSAISEHSPMKVLQDRCVTGVIIF